MSEYIEIEHELADDNLTIVFYSNLTLSADPEERYAAREALEEGSPLAQALFVVEGISSVEISAQEMLIEREYDADWLAIIDDVTAVLRDFFL